MPLTPAEKQAAYRQRQREGQEDDEQGLRDQLGYTDSEKRPKAERDAAAARMLKAPPEARLPADIEAVWGVSPEARATAQILIADWGEERFRRSTLHKAALAEIHHKLVQAEARKRYEKART